MRAMLMRTCLADMVAPSVARAARTALERAGVVVTIPRGQTCCGQPGWSAGHPDQARPVAQAREMAERTVELSQFLSRHGLRPRPAGSGSVTYHDSCHMLRILGERESPRAAIAGVEGVELREMQQTEVCCGFGGTFSVSFPEVSGRLGEEKARNAAATGADELVACDLSCLLHIAGRARRTGIPLRVRHLAEVLAG
jgi:L-lactate dehydrogenase complex protein LldE